MPVTTEYTEYGSNGCFMAYSLNSDYWRKSLALYILNFWLRAQHSAVGNIYIFAIQ